MITRMILAAALMAPAVAMAEPASSTPTATLAPTTTPTAPGSATDVSPLTVVGSLVRPKAVTSWPADGSTPSAGVTVLKITFDQKTSADAWSMAATPGGEMPDCLPTSRVLTDGKTLVRLCTTLPGKTYAIRIAAVPAPGAPPQDVAAVAAQPVFQFTFTPEAGSPVRSLSEAMKLAQLRPEDSPVMEDGLTPTKAAN